MSFIVWSNKFSVPHNLSLSKLKEKLNVQLEDEIIAFAELNINHKQFSAFSSVGKTLSKCFECVSCTYKTFYINENYDFYLNTSNSSEEANDHVILFRKWKRTTSEFDRYKFKNYLWLYKIMQTDIEDYTEPIGIHIKTLIR